MVIFTMNYTNLDVFKKQFSKGQSLLGWFGIITLILLLSGHSQTEAEIMFEETSQSAGILYNKGTYGASWGDLNGDGLPDLWLGHHISGGGPSLFVNNGDGTFTDLGDSLGLSYLDGIDLHGTGWTDYDNDGDQDIIILVGGSGSGKGVGPNIFLENNDGLLEEKAHELGLNYDLGRGRTPLWFDYDGDSLLDIIFANGDNPLAPTVLFRQTPNGFEDVTKLSGLNIEKAWVIQISDLNLDNHMDLVSLVPYPNGIYDTRNLPFENIKDDLNLKKIAHVSDIAIMDFNGDTFPDIFMVRAGSMLDPLLDDKLFIHNGEVFKDRTKNSGFKNPTSCRAVVAGDFDNDTDVDIYLVCSIYATPTLSPKDVDFYEKNLPNILYENLGNGKFVLHPNAGGAEGTNKGTGESVSMADYDNDGFLDFFVTNSNKNKAHVQLFRNLGNENHWIEIDLVGTVSNRDGIGARVLTTSGDVTQLREQSGGVHYRSQNYPRLHFGLGDSTNVDRIVVYWPSGLVHEILNVAVDQIFKIVEPSNPISPNKQISLGISKHEVLCREDLLLISKSSNDAVGCVTPLTAEKLLERGWADKFDFS